MNGKGDRNRTQDFATYRRQWTRIFAPEDDTPVTDVPDGTRIAFGHVEDDQTGRHYPRWRP